MKRTFEHDGHQIIMQTRSSLEGYEFVCWIEKGGQIVKSVHLEPLTDKQIAYYGGPSQYINRLIKDVNEGLAEYWPGEGDMSDFSEQVQAVLRTLESLLLDGEPPRLRRPG